MTEAQANRKPRPALPEAIHRMARTIVERFSPEKVILFGSYARGEATADSDADFLVILSEVGSKRDTAVKIMVALAGLGLPKDVFVMTPPEFEDWREIVGTLAYAVASEGIVMYERPR